MTSLSPEMTGETTGYTISIHFKWFANVCADHLGWDLPLAWGSRSRLKDLASQKKPVVPEEISAWPCEHPMYSPVFSAASWLSADTGHWLDEKENGA